METTLKISKKMAELLAAALPDGDTPKQIAAESDAGRADKTGAVLIKVGSDTAALLHGFARGSISRLDAALAAGPSDDAKRKLMGEHSAWRALARQMPELNQGA